MKNGILSIKGRGAKASAWALAALVGGAIGVQAYDLTPDRGPIAASLFTGNSSVTFMVFNVGSNDWGPVNNCNTSWANAQWRNESGKRMGDVAVKPVSLQYDFNQITNGWFTPNPKQGPLGCEGSHISRGWDDIYTNSIPDPSGFNHSIHPTLLVKVDPNKVNPADENLNNNRVWVTTEWNASAGRFTPMETVFLFPGTTTLTSGDSLFYGAYSTNSTYGKIGIFNNARTSNLTHGNEMIGYQGRQMQVFSNGGAASKNTYTITNGSKVQADFLGQNVY